MVQPTSKATNVYTDRSELVLRVLNATPNGGVADAVLRFDNAILTPGTTHMDAITSPNDGTIVRVWRPGIYRCTFQASHVAATRINLGISLNSTNTTAEPVAGVAGILAAQLQTTPAATVMGASLSYDVTVRPADISVVVPGFTIAYALIRFHGTNGAGAAGGAALAAATAQCQVRRIIGSA